MMTFKFNTEANRFLLAQRGDLTALAAARGGNPDHLTVVWADEIRKTIAKHIRMEPTNVLDIGSGLGLVDVKLSQLYGAFCTLIDGEEPPALFKHAVPFCSRRVVEQFWADNGVVGYQYLSPPQILNDGPDPVRLCNVFDLVLSLRSWCFHYPPSVYKTFVRDHVRDGTVVLLDVRRNRLDTYNEYLATLVKWWPQHEIVEEGEKYNRVRFVVGGGSYDD